MAKFVTERKKTNWVRDFDQLKQGRKTIEEYTDEFTRLLQKVDTTRAWTEEMKKRKFIRGLNPKISPLVYMQNPQDLEEAYDYAAKAATGFDLGKQAEREVSMAEQIEALQIQLAELTTGQNTTQINYVTPPQ